MKYARFEDLPVWQAAIELGLRVLRLTENRALATSGGVTDQIRRAALSVSNNIAEGFERGTTNELITFLYIARGSAGEVRSMLRLLERWPEAQHLDSEIADLISLSESCSRQLRGWADSLQNSEIRGPRHLNDEVRAAAARRKSADAFLARLEAARREGRGEIDERMQQAEALG
jgi:four helix bundle protein